MKQLLTTFTLLMMVALAMAVPAKRGVWKTLKLNDGTEVRVQLVGDEHAHFWVSEDGKTYIQTGEDDKFVMADRKSLLEKAKVRRQQANKSRSKRMAKHRVGEVGEYMGKKKALILLVEFNNKSFKDTNDSALYVRIANEKGFSQGKFKGSMCDYFLAQSFGQFELDFDIVGPIKMEKNYSYYGSNDNDGNDKYAGEMVCSAVKEAIDKVSDWYQYDWNNDGEVDQIYVVYAGKGEADGGGTNTIWPHAYDLSSAAYYGDGTGPVVVATDLVVNTYACGSELSGDGNISGIGTMCHEFSHCLGYPDYYDTDYSGGQGMGSWDLMDSGCYNDDGFQPAGYTSYERWMAGWTEPTVLEAENVTVDALEDLQSSGKSYVIYNKGHRDEFFLLENRQKTGWDASLPGFGMLILHVDYDADAWANNQPNDKPTRQRMTWIPADNQYQYFMYSGTKYYTTEGMATDTYPQGSVNSFNKSSTPAAKFYNKNSDNTYYMDASVEEIKQNATGTVSFKYVVEKDDPGDDPTVTPTKEGSLFYESFDNCTGKGGNDNLWSGSIANASFAPDNEGWVALGSSFYGANKCARFGTSAVNGEATTPQFQLNGETKLTFKAGAWDASKDATTLSLSVKNGSVEPSKLTIGKGFFTTYEATVTGNGWVTITFALQKGRFFLDEVAVIDPTTTGIFENEALRMKNEESATAVFDLQGRRVTQPTKGLYIVNGRKVLIK